MVDYDSFEEFRDPQTYDLECDDFAADKPFIEQWARRVGNPLLDLACGTGRMALHLTKLDYQITGVDIMPEMIGRARQKAAIQAASIEWVVADVRAVHLQKHFAGVYMLMNAFQFLLTRHAHEAMLACVREHLRPDGQFVFETRNPTPHNLWEVRHPEQHIYTLPDGGQLLITEEQYYEPMTQIQHYTRYLTFERANGQSETKTLRTALRYVFPQEMEALLHYNGFEIRESYGSWQFEPLTTTSPAMIYVCQKYA